MSKLFDDQSKIDDLEKEIEDLKEEISGLESRLDEAEGEASSLAEEADDREEEINRLEKEQADSIDGSKIKEALDEIEPFGQHSPLVHAIVTYLHRVLEGSDKNVSCIKDQLSTIENGSNKTSS